MTDSPTPPPDDDTSIVAFPAGIARIAHDSGGISLELLIDDRHTNPDDPSVGGTP